MTLEKIYLAIYQEVLGDNFNKNDKTKYYKTPLCRVFLCNSVQKNLMELHIIYVLCVTYIDLSRKSDVLAMSNSHIKIVTMLLTNTAALMSSNQLDKHHIDS